MGGSSCAPSRCGFMTSRHPASYPRYPAVYGYGGAHTITQLLRSSGYRTAHIGKWHMGGNETNGTYGIDEVYVMGHCTKPKRVKETVSKATPCLVHRDQPIASKAIAILERYVAEARESGSPRPFYMNIWMRTSHHAITPPKQYVDKFSSVQFNRSRLPAVLQAKIAAVEKTTSVNAEDALRTYLGDVYGMDEQVGLLLDKLDELGLARNTIVAFSSDHGPGQAVKLTRKGYIKKAPADRAILQSRLMGSVGKLQGGKHEQTEGGIRVPFIIRWPGKVPAGMIDYSSQLSGLDWLPTVCHLSGM